MGLINLKDFWKNNSLQFDSFKKGLSWTKRQLDVTTLRRISPDNYLIDSATITKSYKEYLVKQNIIYQDRVKNAKQMTQNRISKKNE